MENIELLLTDPKIVKALAHPVRARLLMILDNREASPSQLAEEIGEPLGTVSYHVRTLHRMGLLKLVGEERQRGAVEHYYTGVKWVIHESTWETLPNSLKGAMHQSLLSHIGKDASSAAASGGFDELYTLLNRNVLSLDEEGAVQLAKAVTELMERALAIEAESKERLSDDEDDKQETLHLVLMLFKAPEDHEGHPPPSPAEDESRNS